MRNIDPAVFQTLREKINQIGQFAITQKLAEKERMRTRADSQLDRQNKLQDAATAQDLRTQGDIKVLQERARLGLFPGARTTASRTGATSAADLYRGDIKKAQLGEISWDDLVNTYPDKAESINKMKGSLPDLRKRTLFKSPNFKEGYGLEALFSNNVAKLNDSTRSVIDKVKTPEDMQDLLDERKRGILDKKVDVKAVQEYFGQRQGGMSMPKFNGKSLVNMAKMLIPFSGKTKAADANQPAQAAPAAAPQDSGFSIKSRADETNAANEMYRGAQKVGDIVNKGGVQYKVVGFDVDGEPLVEPVEE